MTKSVFIIVADDDGGAYPSPRGIVDTRDEVAAWLEKHAATEHIAVPRVYEWVLGVDGGPVEDQK